ncbi:MULTISPECIES: TonB-dependent siderophore receptor [unclassified Massilia]|uniref:TonB-dependent receptor plug domain-containing protein n=1 Tax=unclassified Massilia TaxID=2609279 RepID=UPI001B827FFE|nr:MULTISPECIES: TonB-dependent receptor [unclassified Massilia]MBQ5938882.1 TonB-dependent receptor [Massilia sp. AB1]MBQ5962345.1 TonB-dependent receptor [Massilia sp. ZL223]
MNTYVSLACAALLGAASVPAAGQTGAEPAAPQEPGAAQTRQAPPPKTDDKLQQVTISGSRANDTDQRRLATASKMIFGREELDRNGDSNVGEILKRLPGVTMAGPPGRGGGGVRMRGMGNGYTQMLVNGERPPPGFSLESLPPDQVERIEVIRGPVAEHSTQAIAGTINIVLREGYQQKDIQFRASDSVSGGLHSPDVSLAMPGKSGRLSWLTNVMLRLNRNENESRTYDRTERRDGTLDSEQLLDGRSDSHSKGLHASPRFTYTFDNKDTLTVQPFLGVNRSDSRLNNTVTRLGGEPDYARLDQASDSDSTFGRLFGNWLHRMDNNAKLDLKFGFGGANSENTSVRRTYGFAGEPLRVFNDTGDMRFRGANTGGKYTRPIAKGHLLAVGWDVEYTRLKQKQVSEDDGGPLYEESGANLSANQRKIALFAQDEFDISERWSAYLGLRWEGIRTASTGVGNSVKNESRVWSPVLHSVWRIPGKDKDQVRASLTRSYRAAQLNDMIAAPTISADNSFVRPDRSGNPDLKPELATGIDLAYEHYIGRTGIVSASAFVRNVDDLIRRTVTEVPTAQGPRWISRPVNIGKARTSGIELEAKFQLTDLVKDAPNVDVRANYSRFWSDVEDIQGPHNRLEGQAEQTANVGADWRLKGLPLTLGASLNWTPDFLVQVSNEELAFTGSKRQLDLFALWKFSGNTQVRVFGNNLLSQNYDTARSVSLPEVFTSTQTRTYATVGVRLETKL